MTRARVSEDFRIMIPEEIRRLVPLKPGQNVTITVRGGFITLEPADSVGRRTASVAEMATRQGVQPVRSVEALCGGWPEEEKKDGFEAAVRRWRDEELRVQG